MLDSFLRGPERLRTRAIKTADAIAAAAIDAAAFDESPWTREEIDAALCEPLHHGSVCELDGRVVGYCIHQIHKRTIRMVRMAVNPPAQRHGAGSALLLPLKQRVDSGDKLAVTALVPEYWLPAQMLLKYAGFHGERLVKVDDLGEDYYAIPFRYGKIQVSEIPPFRGKNRISGLLREV